MTQEEKELLLKDLCARLPYNTIVNVSGHLGTRNCRLTDVHHRLDDYIGVADCMQYHIDNVKPYLFPMSSMTDEQKKYIADRWGINEDFNFEINPDWGECLVTLVDVLGYVNWLFKNHFDVNGLIPMGLALDATNLNIY